MKKIVFKVLLLILNVLCISTIQAKVKLPAIVSSNMVLQRNTTVKLWGWASANEKIVIKTTWLKKEISVTADREGNWDTEVETTLSTTPQTITISSKESYIELDNVVFGEVWLCSGQSNMFQSLKGYPGQPTFGSNRTIATSANPDLRLFTVHNKGSKLPISNVDLYTGWDQANPNNVSNFSAVAYFFGKQLQEILDVPVGLIHTSWGGSVVQAWMSKDVLQDFEQIAIEELDISKKTNHIPTALFNAMIYPLIPYTIKGVLWYQGESNRFEPAYYKKLFPAMVKDWRARWGIGDFPFYYVQIAPYLYGDNNVFQEVKNTAFLREAQLGCLDIIPNSGMVVTLDIGDRKSIHPPKKEEVANRLLYNALNQTYEYSAIDHVGPILESEEVRDNGIFLKFKNAENGLYCFDTLEGFEIAGDDKVFYPAKAKIIKGKKVFVQSDKVVNPVAVRYAWRNWVVGTLYDTNLLPASSFRTDNWNDATKAE